MRQLLLLLLLLADALLLPAVAQLPRSLAQGGAVWQDWLSTWLLRPDRGLASLLSDEQVRRYWYDLQPLLALAGVALLWPTGSRGRPGKGRLHVDPTGAHGSARWRTPGELANTLQPLKVTQAGSTQGILAGVDREQRPRSAWLVPGPGSRASTNPHVLVLGGSGAGKSRRLVLPNLWLLGQAMSGGQPNSIVVTDPKGELYSHTADYFSQLGYRVHTLNLIEPRRSNCYNPIAEIASSLGRGDRTAAAEAVWDVAHAFAALDDDKAARQEDPFWQNSAESIIAATVYYVAANAPDGQKNMATVYRLLTEYGKDGGTLLDMVFRRIPDLTDPGKVAYGVTQLSVEKTRSSILTTAAVNLRLFADPTVTAMTAGHDYQLASIGQEPTVVYLMLPDDKSSRNAVAAMYLSQAYAALSHLASQSTEGRLPVPVYWILDEFANIGKFKDFDQMIAVMRGRGMAAMIVLQALQQLEARYGKEKAAVITANCDTWLFLRTNDHDTARALSDKMGQYTLRNRLVSTNVRPNEFSSGSSEQLSGRHLLTVDEVLRWPMGQSLVLQAGQFPARLALADISEWPARFLPRKPPPLRSDPPVSPPWLPLGIPDEGRGLR